MNGIEISEEFRSHADAWEKNMPDKAKGKIPEPRSKQCVSLCCLYS